MNNRIITISREFGSGGRTIGIEKCAAIISQLFRYLQYELTEISAAL